MIFLINGSYTVWVAIPMLNKAYFTSWKYPYVLTVDLLTFAVSTLLIFRACFIIGTCNIFHVNLRAILMFQLVQWFEIVLARYLMFPYMIGRRFLGNTAKIYHHYWTEQTDEMVPVHCMMEEWPLFLGGFLYGHHQASCIFFLFSVSAERAVASFYLSDYEKSRRPYISILIIIVSMTFSTGYSLIFALNFFTFLVSSLLIGLVGVTAMVLYALVYYYNTRIRRMSQSNSSKEKYTLARRFQTRENLKSLTMAKWVVTAHAIYVALCQICLMCVYFGVESKYWEIFIYVMDSVVYYSNMFIVPFVICSVPTWKQVFFKHFNFFRRINKRIHVSVDQNPTEDAHKIACVYFEQLGKAWS